MNRKRPMKHHKPRHNNRNRHTGKRIVNTRAHEPGDGNKKKNTKRTVPQTKTFLSEVEQAKEDKRRQRREELKQRRAAYANEVRAGYLAERQAPCEPCCADDDAKAAKNTWLLTQLKAVRCDVVIDDVTGRTVINVIPKSFENRADVRKHMRHFWPFAQEKGYSRHWRKYDTL